MVCDPSVLILSFSDIRRDPRVYRQMVFLRDNYKLTVAGFGDGPMRGVEFCRIMEENSRTISRIVSSVFRLKIRRFEQYYWSSCWVKAALRILSDRPFDLIIANDMNTLPLALRLAAKCGCRVLLDAHEFEPRHFDDSWRFRFLFQAYWDYICRKYLPRVGAMVAVSQGVADEYTRSYGIPCDVLTNSPFYEALFPSPVRPANIRMIHHGGLNPSRRLENMILLMDLLDERFSLDFMFVPNDRHYLGRLEQLARNRPRVVFKKPVPMTEIVSVLNQYDIGLFLLSPRAFNYRMALPNKLFEFIQARLAVAIWPSPEMARLVSENDCGVVARDFTVESMAEALNSLSVQDIQKLKGHSHRAASRFSAERNRHVMVDLVQRLIG